jgi:hypothetical protein
MLHWAGALIAALVAAIKKLPTVLSEMSSSWSHHDKKLRQVQQRVQQSADGLQRLAIAHSLELDAAEIAALFEAFDTDSLSDALMKRVRSYIVAQRAALDEPPAFHVVEPAR